MNRDDTEKGSSSVLITILFACVVLAAAVLCEGAARYGAMTSGTDALYLGGRSVLAGYSRPLKERYGLFGVRMSDADIEERLAEYIEGSLPDAPLTAVSLDDISAETSGFELSRIDIFEDQITEYMKYRIVEEGADLLSGMSAFIGRSSDIDKETERRQAECDRADKEAAGDTEGGESGDFEDTSREERKRIQGDLRKIRNDTEEKYDHIDPDDERTLRNKNVTELLPSVTEEAGRSGCFGDLDGMFESVSGVSGIRDDMYSDMYISRMLTDHMSCEEPLDGHFFRNEIEYVINGDMSDERNFSGVRKRIFMIRQGLNTAYLYTDPEKRSETLAAAESLTPGLFAPLTQLLIISAWAALESDSDIDELLSGGRVPLVKSVSSWKTDIGAVTGNVSDGAHSGSAGTSAGEGLDYSGYLDILLALTDHDEKILRLMDVIQINIKGADDGSFQLSRCFTGFNANAVFKRKTVCTVGSDGRFTVSVSHRY